eukprot:TRINITY_DN24239_c0_g1_i1.p1 TRINITY_DN24239_c0_g1~~TRINITY_DN24239_c0_g1_i1.p1  ORF type:complete len:347 (+),score=70.98 TRINITY_DN24239_c0_g1_i1:75-1115(+)
MEEVREPKASHTGHAHHSDGWHAAEHQLEHRLAEKAGFGAAEVAVERAAEAAAERCAEVAGEHLLERSVTATSERLLERSATATSERLLERGAEAASERLLERGAEAAGERLLERSVTTTSERLLERSATATSERLLERGAETASERLLERGAEAVTERVLERGAEVAGERALAGGAARAAQLGEKALAPSVGGVAAQGGSYTSASFNTTSHMESALGSHVTGAGGSVMGFLQILRVLVPVIGTLFVAHMAHQDWHRVIREWRKHRFSHTTCLFLFAAVCDTFDTVVHILVVANLAVVHLDHHVLHTLERASLVTAVGALVVMMAGELLSARLDAFLHSHSKAKLD